MTRPLGASFADWFSALPAYGGLGLGSGRVSLVMTIVIPVLVGHATGLSRTDRPSRSVNS